MKSSCTPENISEMDDFPCPECGCTVICSLLSMIQGLSSFSCSKGHAPESSRNAAALNGQLSSSSILCIEMLCNIKPMFPILLLQVLGAVDNNMGDGCSQKLATANILRFLLLVLIPCICALIVLLVILLSFVGE